MAGRREGRTSTDPTPKHPRRPRGMSVPADLAARVEAWIRESELNRRRSKLLEISLAVNAKADNVDEVLNLILMAAIDQELLAESGSLFVYDEQSRKLKLLRKRGEQTFVQYTEFALGEGIAGYAGASRSTVLVNNCSIDLRYKPYTATGNQLQSILAVPIISPGEDKLLGVLCVHNSKAEKGFDDLDKAELEDLARIAAIAWNNGLTHQRLVTGSQRDTFTGLLNRAGIEEVVTEFVGKAQLSRQPLSILYMDIDQLKILNDTYSTDVGDRAIRVVADAVKLNTYSTWRTRQGSGKRATNSWWCCQG